MIGTPTGRVRPSSAPVVMTCSNRTGASGAGPSRYSNDHWKRAATARTWMSVLTVASTTLSVCHESTNRIPTITVGISGPDDLDEVVAVDLGRQLVVAGLAPEAERRVDDQALDQEEDHDARCRTRSRTATWCSASGRWPAPGCATGKKLFQTSVAVTLLASSTSTKTTTAIRISRPAMSGPDPVRDREGIDIGFLERRRPGRRARTGQQMRSRRPWTGAARAGARDVLIIPDGRGVGSLAAMLAADLAPRRENAPVRPAVRPGSARIRAPFARTAGVAPGRRRRARAGPGRARPWRRWSRRHPISRPSSSAGRSTRSRWLPAIVALLLWRVGVNRVNRAHPDHPVPRRRTVYWVAGVLVILFAIDSGLALYDTTLFSLHMVQHLLLTLVGPPLLLHGRPDHAPAPGVVARDAAAVHPAGPPLPAHPARRRSPSSRGSCSPP